MKVLYYQHEGEADVAPKKNAIIQRELARLEREYPDLLEKGWRCIVKMRKNGEKSPYYHLDVQSNKGGGSYAEAKVHTLETFRGKAATGGETIIELLRMIAPITNDRTYDEQIRQCEDVDSIPNRIWEWLRREHGIAPCYGGVRIPYVDNITGDTDVCDDSNSHCVETGEIIIAFSGAPQVLDLFFALSVFKALNDSFTTLCPNVSGELDLYQLRQKPVVGFWLKQLGIQEA